MAFSPAPVIKCVSIVQHTVLNVCIMCGAVNVVECYSTVCCKKFMQCMCRTHYVQCASCSVHHVVWSMHCALCSVHRAVWSMQCEVCIMQCAVFIVQCVSCSVKCAWHYVFCNLKISSTCSLSLLSLHPPAPQSDFLQMIQVPARPMSLTITCVAAINTSRLFLDQFTLATRPW